MVKLKEESFIEDAKMRVAMIERVDVLESVKDILLLPNTELMNTKTLAEYYEVGEEAIKSVYNRSRDELEKNGAKTLRGDELRALKTEVQDATLLGRANAVTVYSKRATLNVGMLLRDSGIAVEIRNQLLNGYEKLSDKQKVEGIASENELIIAVVKAKNTAERMIAMSEYDDFHSRHVNDLNSRIEEMKPKEVAFDVFIDSKGNQTVSETAKSIGYGRNKLFKFLRENKVLMKENIPYQSHINRGWFIVKQYPIPIGDGSKMNTQTFTTPKGVKEISKMLKKKGLV